MTFNNIAAQYRENDRYYLELTDGSTHQIPASLYDTMRILLYGRRRQVERNGIYYQDRWTQEVDGTHADFLAGTGRW